MTSTKVKFRPSNVAGREGTIYYQITHRRKVRQLLTNYHLFPDEWDEKRSCIARDSSYSRKDYLTTVREGISMDLTRLAKISRKLTEGELPFSTDDIIDEYRRYMTDFALFNFTHNVITRLKYNGRLRTAETYQSALKSFSNFREDKDIMLDCITPETMQSYEAWLKKRGVVPNTVSFYMRILRAIYNRAVESGAIDDRMPFRKVYTGIDKTVKRALPITAIRKIKSLDLSHFPSLDYARDAFILSFFLRGMSFIDMAFLKKSDLRDGYITYRRRKTGQRLIIRWTKEMQQILDKYPENESCYLLPIFQSGELFTRSLYRNKSYNINHGLKRIARMAGISIPLTLYVARHSWASAARAKGIPVSVISEGMGHDSESTTQIYLASLDTARIDRANSVILNALK